MTNDQSPSFDRRSGDLSADLLLKGALDLQNSLIILEKLQDLQSLDYQGYGIARETIPEVGSPVETAKIKGEKVRFHRKSKPKPIPTKNWTSVKKIFNTGGVGFGSVFSISVSFWSSLVITYNEEES